MGTEIEKVLSNYIIFSMQNVTVFMREAANTQKKRVHFLRIFVAGGYC